MLCYTRDFYNYAMNFKRVLPPHVDSSFMRKYIGTIAEVNLAISLLPLSNLFCYHQLQGTAGGRKFEADLLIVMPERILLVEVKAYSGLYSLAQNPAYFRKQHGYGKDFYVKNPVPQVLRTKRLLEKKLLNLGYNQEVIPLVVFANNFFIDSKIVDFFNTSSVPIASADTFPQLVYHFTQGSLQKHGLEHRLVMDMYYTWGKRPILFPNSIN